MKNLLGGILGAVVTCITLYFLAIVPLHNYPEPFNHIWILLDGPMYQEAALNSLIHLESIVTLVVPLCVGGIVIAGFSKNISNSVRTLLWMGVALGTFYIASVLLLNPAFWTGVDRNILLLTYYLRSILLSFLALVVAIPLLLLKSWAINRDSLVVVPKIETTCECGAVFRSRPLICSNCGKDLQSSPSFSTDTAA